jgi:hypothetical protein
MIDVFRRLFKLAANMDAAKKKGQVMFYKGESIVCTGRGIRLQTNCKNLLQNNKCSVNSIWLGAVQVAECICIHILK